MSTIIHSSPLPDVEIPDQSITDCVFASAADHADEVAITDGAASSYTFAQLHDAARRLGGGLSARGVGPGSTVAVLAPNVPEYAIVFHGIALAGGTVTTINPTYSPEEVRFQLQDASASSLVTIPNVPRCGPGRGGGHRRGGDRGDGAGLRRHPAGVSLRRADRSGAGGLLGARCGPAVLIGHDRAAQGRDAHPPQPRRQHRPDGAHVHARRRGGGPRRAAVLPHLRDAGADEHAAISTIPTPPPRPSTPTAGCTPATWPCSTARATCR